MRSQGQLLLASIVMLGLTCVPVRAQAPKGVAAAQSGGLSATLVRVVTRNNHVAAQLQITNQTQQRIYLTDAREDDSQKAFLSSGEQLKNPFPAGMPYCNSDYADCIKNPYSMDLQKFTYIEPSDTLGMSIEYPVFQPFNKSDTVNFAVVLIARRAARDADPTQAGPPQQVRFNFTSIPLSSQ